MLISGIRLKVTHSSKELLERVKKQSGMHECSYRIIKKATDACHSDICYVYTIEAVKKDENFKTYPGFIPLARVLDTPEE